MKQVKIVFIITIIFMLAAIVISRGESQYESRGKRDPFVPLVGQDRPGVVTLMDVSSIEDVRLEGIAGGPKGKNRAIINGEIVKENDKIGDIEIKAITDKSVTLSINGKNYTLKLPEEGGAKSE